MRMLILSLIVSWVIIACKEPSTSNAIVTPDTAQYAPTPLLTKEDVAVKQCDFKDGTHSASVGYRNPKTEHTAKYELKVHVKDCRVIQIDFPNGGWLDEDHIPATQINENKEAVLKDDKGREWKVRLH